jgi:hypothetical protein
MEHSRFGGCGLTKLLIWLSNRPRQPTKNTGKQTMPEGKSEIPDDILQAAGELVNFAIRQYENNGFANVSRDAIANALLAEREAEHARCNETVRAAWGSNISLEDFEIAASRRWQPIETAPLDGTLVDLWAYRGELGMSGIRPAERYADCRFAKNSYGTEPYGEPRWQGLNDRYITVTPTHWMPLPAPPSSTEER